MTYIKKEDVQKILDSNQKIYETKDYKESIEEEINSLPSINLDDYRKRRIVCWDPFPPRDR